VSDGCIRQSRTPCAWIHGAEGIHAGARDASGSGWRPAVKATYTAHSCPIGRQGDGQPQIHRPAAASGHGSVLATDPQDTPLLPSVHLRPAADSWMTVDAVGTSIPIRGSRVKLSARRTVLCVCVKQKPALTTAVLRLKASKGGRGWDFHGCLEAVRRVRDVSSRTRLTKTGRSDFYAGRPRRYRLRS